MKTTETMLREQRQAAARQEDEDEPARQGVEKTAHVRGLEDELRQRFATPVQIKLRGKDKGQIVLTFASNDDFVRIIEMLRK